MSDWDEDPYEDEYAADGYGDDWSDDEPAETLPCPNCGTEVYEDAPACPVCGEYVTRSRVATAGMPRWFATLGLVGVVIVVLMLIAG